MLSHTCQLGTRAVACNQVGYRLNTIHTVSMVLTQTAASSSVHSKPIIIHGSGATASLWVHVMHSLKDLQHVP